MSPGKKASFSLPAKMVPAWYLLSDFPTCSSSPPHSKYITFYLVRPGNTDISSQWVPYFLLLVPSVPGKVLCWKETLVVPLLLSLSLFLPFLPAVLKQQTLANLTFSSEVLASNPNHQKSLEKDSKTFGPRVPSFETPAHGVLYHRVSCLLLFLPQLLLFGNAVLTWFDYS